MKQLLGILITSLLFFGCISCSKSSDDNGGGGGGTTEVPTPFKKIYGATDMYVEGNYVVIKTTALPDHKSPYYQGTAWASTKYEAYNGTNPAWMQNPNKIA